MNRGTVDEIMRLKRERNAIILAHYYQPSEIQEIADFVGDSYYLSEVARENSAEVIVFCGVKFMAESAKILSPNKRVLMPCLEAGCAMADMVDEKGVKEFKEKYPEAFVVCYINSSAEVKAHCDVSVTSSSALNILRKIPNKQILFLPDKNLGGYIAEFFPEKEFMFWEGYCKYHNKIKVHEVLRLKDYYRKAEILVHPECTKEVRELGDYVGSTTGIIDYATKSNVKDFIIVTEEGVLYELRKKNPEKNFYVPGGSVCCPDMKKTTLEALYDTLLNMKNEILLSNEIMEKALVSLQNMHRLS